VSRILLIEDDADLRVLIEHVLVRDCHEVDPATTVAAGRILLVRKRYDVVLSDGLLPDGTGVEIAAYAEQRGIPAIIVTSHGFGLPKRELAAYRLLLKPVRPAELLEAIERMLNPSFVARCSGANGAK